jgi:hypothetical protein
MILNHYCLGDGGFPTVMQDARLWCLQRAFVPDVVPVAEDQTLDRTDRNRLMHFAAPALKGEPFIPVQVRSGDRRVDPFRPIS